MTISDSEGFWSGELLVRNVVIQPLIEYRNFVTRVEVVLL